MHSTYAGLAVRSEREPFITRANEIALPIGALTMSTCVFIQTLIYICTEKVTHTIHLKKDTSVDHIYKGPLIYQKAAVLNTHHCIKATKKRLLTNTLAISPFKPIRTRRTHERAQSVIAEAGRTHFPILTFVNICSTWNKQTDSKSHMSSWYPSSQWRVCMCQLWRFDRRVCCYRWV